MKALKVAWKLRNLLLVTESAVEPVVVDSRFLSMVLFVQDKSNAIVEIDKIKFKLPNYKEALNAQGVNGADLTCKVVLFKINPYTWHTSAARGKLLVHLLLKVLTTWGTIHFSLARII